ncbi:MAG: DUF3352 domain-containing protein [Trueperaceae bacterium]
MYRTHPSSLGRASSPATTLLRGLGLAVALMLTTSGLAQSLANLLPQETLFAVGVEGLADHEAKFQPFIDEWERLGLPDLMQATFETDTDDLESMEIPPELEGLTILDVLGDQVWFGVSAASYAPLPAVTMVARVSDAAADALTAMIARETEGMEVETYQEGNIPFSLVLPPADTDEEDDYDEDFGDDMLGVAEDMPVVYAQDGNLVFVSSNPDVLRGVLRRYQGAAEPNLGDNANFAETVSRLGRGSFTVYLDLPAVVDVAAPFAQGAGFDTVVDRLSQAFRTAGAYATVSRFTESGMESLSLRRLGDRSLDPRLFDLIAGPGNANDDVNAFVPDGALGYQSMYVDPAGWWAYLGDLVASAPELGIGDLDAFIAENVGIDVGQLLFGWMGPRFAAVTVAAPAATDIGVASENPLGDALYLVEATDLAAAEAGLSELLQMGMAMAGSFADPMGEGASVAPTSREIAGVTVTVYELAPGFEFNLAYVDGYAVLATTSKAMDLALAARAQGGGRPANLAALLREVPTGARSFGITDDQASMQATAETIVSQLGLFAGLGGSAAMDFDAIEAAGDALSEFLGFVARRFGGSYSYTVVDGNVVRGYGNSRIAW